MDGSGEGQMIVKCSGEVQVRVRGNSEVNMGGRQTCFTCVWSIVLRPDLTRQKHNPNRKMFTFFPQRSVVLYLQRERLVGVELDEEHWLGVEARHGRRLVVEPTVLGIY